MTVETGAPASEDPGFPCLLRPQADGELRAGISDSEGPPWSRVFTLDNARHESPGGGVQDHETRQGNG